MIEQLAKKRVFIGTVYLVITVALCKPQQNLWLLGFGISLIGEGIRTWASGYILKNEELAQFGPYSIVRNPLYFGSFFLGMGLTLMSGNRWLIAIYPFLFLPIYFKKIRLEEQDLIQHFGDAANTFFGNVPRFFPNPALYKGADREWNLHRVVFTHKEWTNWFLLAVIASYFFYVLNYPTVN